MKKKSVPKTLEGKLKKKYNGNYNKIFSPEFRDAVKRADQSRKILSKLNIPPAHMPFFIGHGAE